MDNTYNQFLLMLRDYINNDITRNEFNNVDYEKLFDLSRYHKVEGMIYEQLYSSDIISKMSKELVKSLKSITIYSGVVQIRNMNMLESVFKALNDADIPFIGLKGIVLRDMYRHPEHRAMCDADIVVSKTNLKRASDILESLGYSLSEEDSEYHYRYTHHRLPVIEMHWGITGNEEMDNDIWNTSTKMKFGQATMLLMEDKYQLCHLILHMAHHLEGLGFGIRQLMDFALYIKVNYTRIPWDEVKECTEKLDIYRFTQALLEASEKVFGINVPVEFSSKEVANSSNVDLFINDIVTGGVYGRASQDRMIGASININFDGGGGIVKNFFHKVKSVATQENKSWLEEYPLAKKHKMLRYPAAINHIYRSRFDPDRSLLDNIKQLRRGIKLSKERETFMQWLGF